MASFTWPSQGSGGGVTIYANLASFPAASSVPAGTLAVAADTNILYESNGTSWLVIASPSTVTTIGTIDSEGAPSANAATISSNQLIMQSASATTPGVVNNTTQTFSGNKTLTGSLTLPATGGASNAALQFTGAGATTGFYSAGTNEVDLELGGSNLIQATTGSLNINGITDGNDLGGGDFGGTDINLYGGLASGTPYNTAPQFHIYGNTNSQGGNIQISGSGYSDGSATVDPNGFILNTANPASGGNFSISAGSYADTAGNEGGGAYISGDGGQITNAGTITLQGGTVTDGGTGNYIAGGTTYVSGGNAALGGGIVRFIGGETSYPSLPGGSLYFTPGGADTSAGGTPGNVNFTTVNNTNGAVSTAPQLRLWDATNTTSKYVGFQAPPAVTTSVAWKLPPADGTNGDALTTDGSGSLSFTSLPNVTLTAVGSSPNADAASLSGQALTLQPADGTNPGVVTSGSQTIGGVKTFNSAPNLNSLTASLPLQLDASKNITATAIDLSGSQATGTLAAGRFPALTGDVTTSAGSLATTIGANKVANSQLAQMAANTIKGNNTAGTANAADLTVSQAQSLLSIPTSSSPLALNAGGTGTSAASANAAFNALSPITTTGDMIYSASGATNSRLAVGSAGQVLTVTGGVPTWSASASVNTTNKLINSAFDYWQAAGTSKTVANGVSTYVPDQWYVANNLGASGVITFDQVTGSVAGSIFGARVKVTTAPASPLSSGIDLVQVLENPATLTIYNQAISANCQIKALGNVNQISMQFVYATSEAKPTLSNTIGSAAATSVNTGAFTNCNLSNIASGTSATTSGVIGLHIYVSGVSSGNISDLNNGFIIEQASVSLGANPMTYARAGSTPNAELASCQRYFWKSFALTTTPAQNAGTTGVIVLPQPSAASTATVTPNVTFPVAMRTAPTITTYNPSATNAEIRNFTTSTDCSSTSVNSNFYNGFSILTTPPIASVIGQVLGYHITADGRI